MSSIRESQIPYSSYLDGYRRGGAYADCYVADIDRAVSQSEYVEAFYTTALFKIERHILGIAVSKPSTDAEAKKLASGESNSFSAWRVDKRSKGELLLAYGRTRSWLMVAPADTRGDSATHLYFGSAVVPVSGSGKGKEGLGFSFRALLGFHKLYSQALLLAARSKLKTYPR